MDSHQESAFFELERECGINEMLQEPQFEFFDTELQERILCQMPQAADLALLG